MFLSHSIHSSGARIGGTSAHGESLCHGNTSNDIHDHPGAKQIGMKVEIGLILMWDLP